MTYPESLCLSRHPNTLFTPRPAKGWAPSAYMHLGSHLIQAPAGTSLGFGLSCPKKSVSVNPKTGTYDWRKLADAAPPLVISSRAVPAGLGLLPPALDTVSPSPNLPPRPSSRQTLLIVSPGPPPALQVWPHGDLQSWANFYCINWSSQFISFMFCCLYIWVYCLFSRHRFSSMLLSFLEF